MKMKNDTPIDDVTQDPTAVQEDGDESTQPSYVDLDAEVKVKSGINVGGNDQLPAVKAFLQHPARALSVRELAVLMGCDEQSAKDDLQSLLVAGLVHQTNELDGDQFRFRLI
jgi:hypothetical protein